MKKTLRFWILLLTFFVIISILFSTLFSAYVVTKQNVVNHSLEINSVYSEKLAQLADEVFTTMTFVLKQRQYDIADDLTHGRNIDGKLERLLHSSKDFNSVAVVNNEGIIISASPYVGIEGEKLTSLGANESLLHKKTLISDPYISISNRLILMVSTPLWGEEGNYIGFLAGTVYLQEDNIIRTILGEHYAKDGSYVYVVDNNGTLLYHPDVNRIGEVVRNNEVIESLIDGESGSQFITNSQGIDFLAGYTYIPSSQWGVVSQTPYSVAIAPVWNLVQKVFLYSIPFVILLIICTVFFTDRLASPLRKLALFIFNNESDTLKTEKPDIPTWYFEAEQLNKTLENFVQIKESSINTYKTNSLTDPLTGLGNRRYFDETLVQLKNEQKPFSLIIIDIDYFKKVNDEFGHQMGDEVLIFLSKKMKEFVRSVDVCVRLGGEEFIILLPNTNDNDAMNIAERMRENVSHTISPTGGYITISLGVGCYQAGEDINSFLKRVDGALYQSKREGRNKTVLSY
ncbi:sensor domain-containing diguanylate cyclase [Bacillus sp. FJAT-45350]|uniref:sensor domain-containing diguanylate cyclase n=1 Tax=Bacillus sp. FJAT-45350 TaxID=2011014 RepID=UPI000BB7FC60|nr:sensor domain-containing diguanylate cyclase [Bacillus sp. FJAT-45350]